MHRYLLQKLSGFRTPVCLRRIGSRHAHLLKQRQHGQPSAVSKCGSDGGYTNVTYSSLVQRPKLFTVPVTGTLGPGLQLSRWPSGARPGGPRRAGAGASGLAL
eukprot:1982510-Rhodomonas_salina.1